MCKRGLLHVISLTVIHFWQVGISAGGGKAFGFSLVALGFHRHGGVVQGQQAGVTVLSGRLFVSVQLLQDFGQDLSVTVVNFEKPGSERNKQLLGGAGANWSNENKTPKKQK